MSAPVKTFVLDLPEEVDGWIGDRLTNRLLAEVFATSEWVGRESRRLTFPAVPGVRAALDDLVVLVDGVRAARRSDRIDSAACQLAIERLDAIYREIRAPWCDTCKLPAIWREHLGLGWVHDASGAEAPETGGHEVTVKEWNQT